MLCTNCNSAPASYHYKTLVGNTLYEQHLCPACAAQLSSENDGIGSMFSSLFGQKLPERKVCPVCGVSESEVGRNGQVGCAQCYDTFSAMLEPYIRRIHGSLEHTGRFPQNASADVKMRHELQQTRQELQAAINAEEYEKAAQLRDRLRELEG